MTNMCLLSQVTTTNDVMSIVAPLGVAGILAWYLWYNVSVAWPKQIADNNERMDKREEEYRKREFERDSLYRDSFEKKDTMFCGVIEGVNITLKDMNKQRQIEAEKCQQNYDKVLTANAQLVAQSSILSQIILDNEHQLIQEKTIVLIVEDSPMCAHVAKKACEEALKEISSISFATVECVSSLKQAIKRRRDAYVIVLDVNLGEETNVNHAQAFIHACSCCPIVVWSGSIQDTIQGAYAILNKTIDGPEKLKKTVAAAIRDFPGFA